MVKVEKIIPGGTALGTLEDGKKAFFWNALPGETVTDYQITKNKSHYLEAIATAVSDESENRVLPKDPCFLATSPWQIIDYPYELELKQALVTELFREHHIDIDVPPVITDEQDYYYRNKMEYALYWDNKQSRIELAFHARGSHRKIPITKSSIERPKIFEKAKELVDELNSRHEEARKYQSLLLRCNQKGEVSGGFYENHQPHPVFDNLTDTILGREFFYSPNGFFQINLPVYEMALTDIKNHISTDNVLDLYTGVGTIGLSVAPDRHLTLVECDKFAFGEMVRNIAIKDTPEPGKAGDITKVARFESIRDNGSERRSEPRNDGREQGGSRSEPFRNIKPILAKSEEVTDFITNDQTVILDPPRAGCDKRLIEKLLEVRPSKIIYLSCNPATQARDVKMLLDCYKIESVQTFNFFPHTPHIENEVVLTL